MCLFQQDEFLFVFFTKMYRQYMYNVYNVDNNFALENTTLYIFERKYKFYPRCLVNI